MKQFDKTRILENTPKIALVPILVSLILMFGGISLLGGLICLALGGIIVIGGLLLAADTFKQVVSRLMGTFGVILIGVGLGVAIVTESGALGIFTAIAGVSLFIWALKRITIDEESTKKSVIILAVTFLLFTSLVAGSYNAIFGISFGHSASCGHQSCEENGPFPCYGKNNTCPNKTDCYQDLYCDSCD